MQVIDFGSSCYDHQRVYTYIQSRFYRAPEVILGVKYGMAIDMWSLGCILAELYTGYALLPGEDEADQLACIIELLGMPPKKLLEQSKRASNFFSAKGHPRYCLVETFSNGLFKLGSGFSPRGKERRPPGKKELTTALKGCDDLLFIDFLQCCLEWDPDCRMTPSAALKHAWFRRRRLPMLPPFTGVGSTAATVSGPVTTNPSVPTVSSGVQQQPPNPVLNYLPKQLSISVVLNQNAATSTTQQSPYTPQQSSHATPSRTVVNQGLIANGAPTSLSNGSSGAGSGGLSNGTAKVRPPITSSSEESMVTVYNNPRFYQRNDSIGSNGSVAMSTSITASQQPLPSRHPSSDPVMPNGNRSQQQLRPSHHLESISNGSGHNGATMTTSTISNSGNGGGANNGSGAPKLPHIQSSTVT